MDTYVRQKHSQPLFCDVYMGWTFQAAAGLQDSDIFQKAGKMVLRCILSAVCHLLGFTLLTWSHPGCMNTAVFCREPEAEFAVLVFASFFLDSDTFMYI